MMDLICRRKNRIAIYFVIFVLNLVLILWSMSLGEFFARDWGRSDSWYTEDTVRHAASVRQVGLLAGGLSGLGLILELSRLEEKPAQPRQKEQNS